MTDTIDTRQAKTPEIIEPVERPAAVVHIGATMVEFPHLLDEALGLAARTIAGSSATIADTLVPTDRVKPTMLPGSRAVTATHVGPYDESGTAWS